MSVIRSTVYLWPRSVDCHHWIGRLRTFENKTRGRRYVRPVYDNENSFRISGDEVSKAVMNWKPVRKKGWFRKRWRLDDVMEEDVDETGVRERIGLARDREKWRERGNGGGEKSLRLLNASRKSSFNVFSYECLSSRFSKTIINTCTQTTIFPKRLMPTRRTIRAVGRDGLHKFHNLFENRDERLLPTYKIVFYRQLDTNRQFMHTETAQDTLICDKN